MIQAYWREIQFNGRAGRSEFARRFALTMATAVGMAVLLAIADSAGIALTGSELVNDVCVGAYLLLLGATWLALAAPAARRLHDTDRTAAWVLLAFVPFGVIALLVLLVLPGTDGPNRFGERTE